MNRYLPRILLILTLVGTSVSAQRAPISQELVFTPFHASGIYDVGETVGWTVEAARTPPSYAYKWTIRRNNAVVIKEGTLDLSSGKATIDVAVDRPEMIYVAVQAYAASPAGGGPDTAVRAFEGGNTGRNTGFYAVGAAVAPLEDRLVHAASHRFRRVLGGQARCAGSRACESGPHACRNRRGRRRHADIPA
jgi:hypothetical protein